MGAGGRWTEGEVEEGGAVEHGGVAVEFLDVVGGIIICHMNHLWSPVPGPG